MLELNKLTTEARNPGTAGLDTMTPLEIATVMNREDEQVVAGVRKVLPEVAAAIGWVQESFEAGGKLVYMGAGTSGRLGVLDSVECPPTFGVPPEMVVGLIAGGDRAFVKAVEGAEDSEALALEELKALPLNGRDVVIGIAASGRTPYVIGGLQYARSLGCKTVAIACNAGSLVGNAADLAIEPVVGPEVLDVSFTPLISMLIAVPLFVLIVMPVTGWLSTLVSAFLNLFINSTNPVVSVIAGYILAATFLPLVLLGLHRGLVPIYAIQIESLGGTTLFPAVAMAGAGQVGAAIALYIKAKRVGNHRLNRVIAGALPAGILGIGEPLIYGVTLPLMKPFITAGLGAGFGGAYVMLTHVMSTAYSPSGLLAVTHMLPECMLNYLIGMVIAYIAAAVITYIFIPVEDIENA